MAGGKKRGTRAAKRVDVANPKKKIIKKVPKKVTAGGKLKRTKKAIAEQKREVRRLRAEAKGIASVLKKEARQGKFESLADSLGISVDDVKRRYGTLKEARLALKQQQRYAREQAAEAVAKRLGITGHGEKGTAQQAVYAQLKEMTARQIAAAEKRLAKQLAVPVKRAEAKKRAAAKVTAAARRARALPKGTKISSLPGYPPLPPPAPGPQMERGEKAILVQPSTWRPPIMNKSDPGWYMVPDKKGGYKWVSNPIRAKKGSKKSRKAPAKKSFMARLPLIGGMFGKKSKKGHKNPAFSVGEVAKIVVASGASYYGAGIVSGFGERAVGAIGVSGIFGRLAGAAASIGVAHLAFKDSDAYYVPVMAGVGAQIIKGLLSGSAIPVARAAGRAKEAGDRPEGLLGHVTGMFKGGMSDASDDQLLASIDVAPLGEYVDVGAGVGEYVGAGVGEYVDVGVGEYVDVGVGEDELEDELDDEYEDVGVGEYVDVGVGEDELEDKLDDEFDEELEGYEALADDDDEDELDEELEGYEALAGSWDASDPTLGYDGDVEAELDELDGYEAPAGDSVESLLAEYSADIPGVSLGGLSGPEQRSYGMVDDEIEELANGYEALADDLDEAADLGAVHRSRGQRMWRTARAIRGQGHRLSPRSRRILHRRLNVSRAAVISKLDAAMASKIARMTSKSLQEATNITPAKVGTPQHIRATFGAFRRRFGATANNRNVKQAFFVAYRKQTKGYKAAAQAAVNAGVPARIAAAIAAPLPLPSFASVASGKASRRNLVRGRNSNQARKIKRVPRVRHNRRVGKPSRDRYLGIFTTTLFGPRGLYK